mmetsp:Transcript_14934/g.34484  ORF Transcript_14934/g.34484 Transcript_14934/m.34484 type:complete len:217 (-) Transcript_14934:291-941(-)
MFIDTDRLHRNVLVAGAAERVVLDQLDHVAHVLDQRLDLGGDLLRTPIGICRVQHLQNVPALVHVMLRLDRRVGAPELVAQAMERPSFEREVDVRKLARKAQLRLLVKHEDKVRHRPLAHDHGHNLHDDGRLARAGATVQAQALVRVAHVVHYGVLLVGGVGARPGRRHRRLVVHARSVHPCATECVPNDGLAHFHRLATNARAREAGRPRVHDSV